MFCSYCGQPLAEDMAFCVRCGRPVEKVEEEALPLEFDDAPVTTGPLPRLDEDGNPVDDAESDGSTKGEGENEGDNAASKKAVEGPSQAQKLAALVKPAGPKPMAAEAPVVRVHKSPAPMIIVFVLVAIVIGCVCFVGGMYVVSQGILGPYQNQEAPAASQQPAESAEPPANEEGADAQGATAPAADDEDESGESELGRATADEVALAVQEGWEALIAEEFSEDAQRAWTGTVLTLQPEGVQAALAALVRVDGESLLPLYLYDAAPVQDQLPLEEFLEGRQAAVSVEQVRADKTDLAQLNVYFGDLGQTVAGQVQKVELPFDVAEAYRLIMEVAPVDESSATDDATAGEESLAINEGALSYVVYHYEGRWYLFAPQLQKADV